MQTISLKYCGHSVIKGTKNDISCTTRTWGKHMLG